METYIGYIKSPHDALLVFEACRRGQLNRVQRRLSSKERIHIRSGSIFAWDEREAGMRRWTDGRTWSPSRVLGNFLTYRELDTKRRPSRTHSNIHSANHNKQSTLCSYKSSGLIKQSFSICTSTNQKLHLISYYSKSDAVAGRLKQPSNDPMFSQVSIPKGVYPELNPLDMAEEDTRQDGYLSPSPSIQSHPTDSPTSSPSLSSSPSTCDDELLPDLSSPYSPYPSQYQYLDKHPTMPIQDIAWERFPSSEDQRQLRALQNLLKL
ncbi:Gti1/Pac2 family-domain-containing protein [Pilobolus umbonatus]|nr:Gti1/Pac2 family-domain-containing protein [Pilobolus umbonatus]